MAIYHLSSKHVRRSRGRSSVAAAAYRAGIRLWDERQGRWFDYTGRRADVVYAEIILPSSLDAKWAADRQRLWSAIEMHDTRKNARTATELEGALPFELNDKQRDELVRGFCQEMADRYGVAVDAAIHRPKEAGAENVAQPGDTEFDATDGGKTPGADPRNWHAHLLMTTWTVASEGIGKKVQFFPDDEAIKPVRKLWADHVNQALERAGLDVRVDHRSNAERGIEEPPGIHIGPAASRMERRGLETDRGDQWLAVQAARRRVRRNRRIRSNVDVEGPRNGAVRLIEQHRSNEQPVSGRLDRLRKDLRCEVRHFRIHAARSRMNNITESQDARRARFKAQLLWEQLRGHFPLGEDDVAWLRRRDRNGAGELVVQLKRGARVRDDGNVIAANGLVDERAVALVIACARAHGWKQIWASGDDDFKRKVRAAAKQAGILVAEPTKASPRPGVARDRQSESNVNGRA